MADLADIVLKSGIVLSASGLLVALAGRLAEDYSISKYGSVNLNDSPLIAGASLVAVGAIALVTGAIVKDRYNTKKEDLEYTNKNRERRDKSRDEYDEHFPSS